MHARDDARRREIRRSRVVPLAHWTITGSALTMVTRAVLEPQRALLFVLRQVRVRLPFVRMWDVILIIMGMTVIIRRAIMRVVVWLAVSPSLTTPEERGERENKEYEKLSKTHGQNPCLDLSK